MPKFPYFSHASTFASVSFSRSTSGFGNFEKSSWYWLKWRKSKDWYFEVLLDFNVKHRNSALEILQNCMRDMIPNPWPPEFPHALCFGAILHFCTPPPPHPHPRVRVRAMVKLSATFFHDESSITIGGGVRKCNSALSLILLEIPCPHLGVG